MLTFTLRDTLDMRAICHSIGRVIYENFTEKDATLITLRYSSSDVMSPKLARRIFNTWAYRVRRHVGKPFQFVRVTDLNTHSIHAVDFYVIVDLPIDVCREVCSEWFAGDVSISALNEEGLDKIAQVVMYHPYIPGTRIWAYSSGEKRNKKKTRPYRTPFCSGGVSQ